MKVNEDVGSQCVGAGGRRPAVEVTEERAHKARSEIPTSSPSGRPPVLDDSQLDELVCALSQKSGRPPKIEELIAASGGCQRQRASRAVRRFREGLAVQNVRSIVALPPAMETEHRAWTESIMTLASRQLASHHEQMLREVEEREAASTACIQEHVEVSKDLRARLADQAMILAALERELALVRSENAALTSELAVARAIAAERSRILSQLSGASMLRDGDGTILKA